MIKGLSVCAVSLMLGSPALAGGRPHDDAVSAGGSALKREAKAVQPGSNRTPAARSSVRFALPAQAQTFGQPTIRSSLAMSTPRRAGPSFNLVPGNQGDAVQTSLRLAETTSGDGGRHAVHDALSDHRKPRFRRSALGTMLTLRLDGEPESPAFSVGGGGVAAAVWQAVPKP